MGQRLADEGHVGGEVGVVEDLGLRGRRADGEAVGADLELFQVGKAGDVDEDRRFRQPHVEHRHQRLAPGDDAGVLAMFGKACDGFVDRVGDVDGEGGRFHELPPNFERILPRSPLRGAASGAARATRARKNWLMSRRAAPERRRPPTEAMVPERWIS